MKAGVSYSWRVLPLLGLLLIVKVEGDEGIPRITEQPKNELVVRGQPVTLNCKAEGEPTPRITWFKDGAALGRGAQPQRYFLHDSSLYFVEVTQSRKDDDSGTYWCEASNRHGVARSRNATLEIAVLREEFRTQPSDAQVAQTETARLRCDPPRGHPAPQVSWLRNGEPLDVTGSRRLRVAAGGDLVVSDARHHDEGAYACVATNAAGVRRSRPARLTVHVKPFFLRPPADVTSAVSRRAQLSCQVSGDPHPVIEWRRVGGELPVGRVHVTDDKSLRIDDVRLDDEGEYTCRAENAVGSVTGSARLSVTAPPAIVSRATIKESDVSEPVALDCRAQGRPPPLLYWLKEGRAEPLAPSSRHSLGANGSLVLSRPRPGDQGYYLCGAVSAAGSDLLRVELLLRSQPAARLVPARQQARHLLDRRPLMVLTARPDSAAGALLVWSQPAASAAALDGYYVRYRATGTGPLATVTVPDKTATSHRLTGLRAHTEYQAMVSPYYRGAEGRASPLVVFRTAQDAPSAPPEELTARVINKTSVLLHWRPPPQRHINGILSGYRLLLLANDTQLSRNYTLNDTTPGRRLTQLAPHTRYWVQVAAVTSPGAGPMTAPLGFTTGGPAAAVSDAESRVMHETWFIALIGFLVFVVVSLLVGLVYVKRQYGVKESLSTTTSSASKPLRQEAMWVDRGWRPADSDKDSSLSEQKLLGYQHQQQQAPLCAEYAELDQLREDGPYASACVIRPNPLSRLYSVPTGYTAATFSAVAPAGSSSLPTNGGRGYPTLSAGDADARRGDSLTSGQPCLADMLPPPPSHPPPGQHAQCSGGGHRPLYHCSGHCVECSCSEQESSYDERPCASLAAARSRHEPTDEADHSDTYYGIPAGAAYRDYSLRASQYPHIPSTDPAGGVIEKLA